MEFFRSGKSDPSRLHWFCCTYKKIPRIRLSTREASNAYGRFSNCATAISQSNQPNQAKIAGSHRNASPARSLIDMTATRIADSTTRTIEFIDTRTAARLLCGDVSGRDSIVCPGPGHSHRDRSLSVRLVLGSEDGFVVYSHAGDPIRDCKDHVRERLGLAPWRPRHRGDETPPKIRRHIPAPTAE